MDQDRNRYVNEIISIFMMLMLILALVAGQSRDVGEARASAVSVSVTNASKVATEPLRRPANGGRRIFD